MPGAAVRRSLWPRQGGAWSARTGSCQRACRCGGAPRPRPRPWRRVSACRSRACRARPGTRRLPAPACRTCHGALEDGQRKAQAGGEGGGIGAPCVVRWWGVGSGRCHRRVGCHAGRQRRMQRLQRERLVAAPVHQHRVARCQRHQAQGRKTFIK